jgi:phosphoserine phosphatase RsbU/P
VSVPRLAVHDALGQRIVTINRPVLTIGRGTDRDLQLSGTDVSRDHAEIARADSGYVLRDRGSRHGTFVNGAPVSTHTLTHGDQIALGGEGAVMVFLSDDPTAEPGAPAGGDLRHVAELLEALRAMGGDRVLDEVLTLVVDAAIEATGAERGFILLAKPAAGLEMTIGRAAGRVTLSGRSEVSRKIPDEVFATGRTTVVGDLLEGADADLHAGTVRLGIRQVLCVPLRLVRYRGEKDAPAERLGEGTAPAEPQNIGVLYMDSRDRGGLLSPTAQSALEALATHAAIAIENARLYQETLEKVRIDRELQVASAIQQTLLPEGERRGPFFAAVGASVPSRTIGGDFFDYQDLGDRGFAFSLGDVTGKGPAAALLAALVQGILAARAASLGEPDAVLADVNRILLERRLGSRFVTLFLGALAPDGVVTYSNAGHNPPFLFTRGSVLRLEAGGTLAGAFESAPYERGTARMEAGDTLVLVSDGVVEAEDASGNQFGDDGIARAVAPALAEDPPRVLEALFAAVAAFTGGAPQHDDFTAVVLRFR